MQFWQVLIRQFCVFLVQILGIDVRVEELKKSKEFFLVVLERGS
jgi:hypothetical protein